MLLILSSPAILKKSRLMLLLACSVGMTYLLALLHALPPGFLVSITDAVGRGILACCLAIFWAARFLIGSVPAIVKAVTSSFRRPKRAIAPSARPAGGNCLRVLRSISCSRRVSGQYNASHTVVPKP